VTVVTGNPGRSAGPLVRLEAEVAEEHGDPGGALEHELENEGVDDDLPQVVAASDFVAREDAFDLGGEGASESTTPISRVRTS